MKRNNSKFIASAEYQVLKLMIDNKDLDTKELTESSFPHKAAKILFRVIDKLQTTGESVNEQSLYREANFLDPEFDLGVVRSVLSIQVDNSNFESAYSILLKKSQRGRASKQLSRIIEHLESEDDLNTETITGILYKVQDDLSSGTKKILTKSLAQCIDEYEMDLIQRQLGKFHMFYDSFLDSRLIKRAAPGQVILAAGSTGTGKSVYALNIINGLVNNNVPSMYFSLEMDTESTMDRWMALRCGVDVSEFYRTGKDLDPTIRMIQRQKQEVEGKPFRFIDEPSISLATITKLIREFKMVHKVDYAIVFIDLITQVKDFVTLGKSNLSTTMELAVNRLNAIAKKENVCFFCVAQMNRDADSQRIASLDELHKLRPTINNIKNSHALGERSRCVLSLFRPKYYAERLFPEDETVEFMPDHLEVQIVKQSMGKVGVVGPYLFDGPQFRLTPISSEITEQEID